MKYSNLTHHFASLLLLAGAFSACRDQVDFEAEHQKLIEFQYKENFTNRFGEGAENQNFNMAQQVTATVHVDEYEDIQGAVIKVFNGNPYSKNSALMAEFPLTGSTMTFAFDAPKNQDYVYVVRERGNGFHAFVLADIQDDNTCEATFLGTGAATRAANDIPDVTLPDFWKETVPEGQYPTEAPSGATEVTATANESKSVDSNIPTKDIYIHDVTISQANFWMGGKNLYIGDNVTIETWNNPGDGTPGVNFYLLPGAKLTFKGDTQQAFGLDKSIFTVCAGATLVFDAPYGTNLKNQTIYNRGTVKASNLDLNNTSTCYNEGELIVDNKIQLSNGTVTLINSGSIKVKEMNLEGSSSFYNTPQGDVNVTGTSTVNSNKAVWYNMGKVKTGYLIFNAHSTYWINDCELEVVEKLTLVPGDAGTALTNTGYIVCKNSYFDVASFYMTANSQLRVLDTATFKYNCWRDKRHGIISTAKDNDWALFKAKKIRFANNAQHGSASYVGHLLVDCTDFPERTTDSGLETGYNWSCFEGAKFASAGDGYTIEADDCAESYTPDKPVPPTGTPYTWMVACEDLGASDDFDFNDVVFSVSHTAGKTELYVTPLAAGGVLGSIVMYDNQPIGEIHYLLNGSSPATKSGSYEMLNTTRGANEIKAVPVKVDNVPSDFTMTNSSFQIAVIPNGSSANENNASLLEKATIVKMPVKDPTSFGYTTPQMLILPDGWIWPAERHQIDEAYPDFASWVSNNLSDWTSNSVSEHLFKDYQASNDNNNGNAGSGSNSNTGNNTGSGNTDNGGNSSGSTPEEDAPSVPEDGEIVLFAGSINLNWYPGYSDLSSFSWNNITAGTVLHIESDNNQSPINIKLGYIYDSGFYEMLGGYYTESSIDFTLTKEHIEAFSKGLNIRGEGTLTKLSLKK